MREELMTSRGRNIVWHEDLFRLEDAKNNNFGSSRLLAGEGIGGFNPASPKPSLAVRVDDAGS